MFSEPRDLFHAAQTAIASEDWRALTEMCDSASLRLFQLQTLQSLKPRPTPKITVEEYLKLAPNMPREVAEYQVSTIGQNTGPEARLKEDFPTLGSLAELTSLTPMELFAAWLEGKSMRRQLERALLDQQIPAEVAKRIRRAMDEKPPLPPSILLAVVPDGSQIAHLLYRDDHRSSPDPAILEEEVRELQRDLLGRNAVQVETIRWSGSGGWGLIANWGMLGLGHNAMFFEPLDDDSEAV